MRVRKTFAAIFAALIILSAYLGLAPSGRDAIPRFHQSDKALHFITFFLLTLCFYWILETNRRRVVQLTLFICTFVLGVGSELAQGFLPNGREFDLYDILANVVGSTLSLIACNWYHKRMLERKRMAKSYQVVPGDDQDRDLELGEGTGPQETGVTSAADEQEADDWNNTADNWEVDDPSATEEADTGAKKTTD